MRAPGVEARICVLSLNRRSDGKHLPAIFEISQVGISVRIKEIRLKTEKTKLFGVNSGGNEKRGIIKMPLNH